MKKIILTLIVLGAVGGGTYAYYMRKGTPEPTVSLQQLTRGDIAEIVQATGTLSAVKTVNVGTQVSGVVQNLYADFNHIVKKGQVIARLDPSLIQTAIEQRKASVTRAEADLERLRVSLKDAERKLEQAKGLWEKQLIPRDQLDTAELNVTTMRSQIKSSEAGLIQAKADLNTQEVNLGHTIIKAPIDGIVIQRSIDEGATVQSSMTAPTLYIIAEDLAQMQVLANIDEAEIGRIRPGQAVSFHVDAYPTDRFYGTVAQIRLQPVTVQNVVTYATVINAPNPNYKLTPGMTANVEIEIARRSNVLRAPAAAVRFRPTNDMFTALKQEPPPEIARGGRGGGPGGGGGRGGNRGQGFNGASGQQQQPGASAPAAAPQQPAAGNGGAQPQSERQPGAAGGGDRGGRNANMTPEEREARRKQFEERMKNMPPEERERMQQRMARGGGRGNNPSGENGQGRVRSGASSATQGGGIANTTATTIDALFAPIVPTEGRGRLWFWENKQLRSVAVRTGITDGTWVEIVEGSGEGAQLQPGTEVVTNLLTGLEAQQRPGQQGAGSNPLMPQRGNPRGGGPGGGGGRGR